MWPLLSSVSLSLGSDDFTIAKERRPLQIAHADIAPAPSSARPQNNPRSRRATRKRSRAECRRGFADNEAIRKGSLLDENGSRIGTPIGGRSTPCAILVNQLDELASQCNRSARARERGQPHGGEPLDRNGA